MNLIAAVDRNWAIGKNNQLLVRIPADQKMFRLETTGKTVIMGRKTLESFPGGQPLKNRRNIVLTRDENYQPRDVEVVHSVEEALELVKDCAPEDVYCIGGGSVYKEMLPYCDTAYITMIDYAYEADVWFPDLKKAPGWKLVSESEEQTYFDLEYTFQKYVRE